MRKKVIVLGLAVCALVIGWAVVRYFGTTHQHAPCTIVPSGFQKRIMILYSRGGGGHSSAYAALTTILLPTYEVIGVNLWDDIFSSLDPIKKITLGFWGGEDIYNAFAAQNSVHVMHFFARYGLSAVDRYKARYVYLAQPFFVCQKPDLIISVMPIFNDVVACAAKNLSIPFLIFPPDFDLGLYVNNISSSCMQHVYCAVSFDDPIIYATAPSFDKTRLFAIGFPLRKSFLEAHKDKANIRKEWGLPDNKPCVMVLMGASGSSKLIQYLRRLAGLEIPAHLVICIGRNEKLRSRIKRITFGPQVSYSVVGFTQKIADLMAVCNVMTTKPGATSVAEAIQMRLPLLLDDTSGVLRWERMALEFVQKHKLGKIVHSFREINILLQEMLIDASLLTNVRQNMAHFDSAQYPHKIVPLIQKLLEGPAIKS